MSSEPFKIVHDSDYHDIVNNKESLKRCTEKLLNNIIDEITLGIIFDIHRKFKTRAFDLHDEPAVQEDEEAEQSIELFSPPHVSNTECICPNCNRDVLAIKFAPHLEICMGMGTSRLRNASRRIASNKNNNSKERDNTTYTEMPSDDEEYGGWSSSDKRRKKKHRNGNKKGKGTPKKNNNENDSIESMTVDIEGEDDMDVFSNNSNSSSPVDSPNTSSFKKQEKKKIRRNNTIN